MASNRIYCAVNTDLNLTIVDRAVVLEQSKPLDEKQHWTKHDSPVYDADRRETFALVNPATGKALQHPETLPGPVRIVPYDPHDLSVLWTKSTDLVGGFYTIRKWDDPNWVFYLSGGKVTEGIPLLLWSLNGQKNQLWKIEKWKV